MKPSGIRARNHSASELFEPVTELDVFHAIDAKLFIVDRKEIIFYVSKDNRQEDTAIWLNSDLFAQAFSSLFEMAVGGD